MKQRYDRLPFYLAVIILTCCLGGASGLLLGMVVFGRSYAGEPFLFFRTPRTATPIARVISVVPTLTPSPTSTATLVPPTETPIPPSATPTVALATPTSTATRVVVRPPATPTVPPGVYVTNIRTDPAEAKQKQDITFYVTFLNATGVPQRYRWFVYVYQAGESIPIGQTSADRSYLLPPGTSEHATANTWKVGPGMPCADFVAKLFSVRADGIGQAFATVNGQEAALTFVVCP